MPLTIITPTLSRTRSVATCEAHKGASTVSYGFKQKLESCAKAVAAGLVIMIVDWKPCPVGCIAAVDGFTVYLAAQGVRERFDELPFHITAFGASGSTPPTPYGCYQVRAHVRLSGGATRESDFSNQLCE